MGCWGQAEDHEGTTDENQDFSVEEVIERLAQVEVKLHGLRVHCLSTTKQRYSNVGVIGEEPEKIFGDVWNRQETINAVWHCRNDASWRFEADFVGKNFTADGIKQTKRFSAYAVFDGPRGRGKYLWLNSPSSDVRVSRDEERYGSTPQGHLQSCPLEFLTQSSGRSFSDELRQDGARISRREILDDRTLVVLTTKAHQIRPNIQHYREFWIDVERGVVVRRQTFSREADVEPWKLVLRQDCGDFKWDAGAELWLPTSAKEFESRGDGQGRGSFTRLEVFAYKGWKINPQTDRGVFSIDQSWYSPNDRR